MTNNIIKNGLFVATLSLAWVTLGAAGWYNCETYAVEMPVSDYSVSLSMVREWNERGYDETTKAWTGCWLDGDTTGAVENQFGCCWLSVTMEKGKDYVIGVSPLDGCTLMDIKKVLPTYTTFQKVSYGGMNYLYIRAEDWKSFDTESVSYYIKYAGNKGSVNKTFSFVFRQCSIDDIIPAVPGTVKCPLELDVSEAGETTIASSTERQFGRLSTAYKASLKAGERYTFVGSHPTAGLGVVFATTNWAAIPGSWENDVVKGKLVITVTEDYDFTLLAMPDDDNWETGNVGGGTIAWHLGADPEPQPVSAGTYIGTLSDVNEGSKVAEFNVVAKFIDDGSTNFTAVVIVDGMQVEYALNAFGELQGQTSVGGKTYKSYFEVSLTGTETLKVDGSMTLDDGGIATEFFFSGALGGGVVEWSDSFLKHDATVESAKEMGISEGAFCEEPAGSETLIKVQNWGARQNVKVSDVKSAEFSTSGDPTSRLSMAYLLDCAYDEAAIEADAAEFVIVDFNPATGVVVAGGKEDGDAYGNGYVQVRTSLTPGGTFDTSPKPATGSLFYRAYLVR